MYEIFGFKILTKEERRQRDEAYARMVFPGGEEQKQAVLRELLEKIPRRDKTELLYLYASVRQHMIEGGADFDTAYRKVKSARICRLDETEAAAFRAVVETVFSAEQEDNKDA